MCAWEPVVFWDHDLSPRYYTGVSQTPSAPEDPSELLGYLGEHVSSARALKDKSTRLKAADITAARQHDGHQVDAAKERGGQSRLHRTAKGQHVALAPA